MITQSRYIKTGNVTTIEKEISHNGKWWIPSDSVNKVNGTLIISPSKGISLDLFANFKHGFTENELADYEIINGETREGGLVTLYNCFEVIKKRPMGHGEIHQTFKCKTLLWGNLFSSKSEMVFNHYQVEFPYNNYFFIDSMFDRDYGNNIITLKDSYKFEIELKDLKIILSNYNYVEEGIYHLNLKKRGLFFIKCDTAISIDKFNNNILFPIQNYFGFLSDVYNWVLDLKAKLGREDESNNKFIYIVDTYQFSRNNVKEIRPLLNFAKPDPSQFTIPLSNWLKKYSELKIITDLYSDVIYREGNSPTVQFLLLVQACEHYHSIRFNNNLETKETYNLKVKEVLNSIDKKHKVWLNDAVRNANNKTLKIMLTELFADNILIFKSVISDIDKIVQKIGDTRNYYTHFNKALKHKISVGEELNFLIAILLLLLKSIILKELGIDQLNTLYALKGQGIHRAAIEKSRILGFLK